MEENYRKTNYTDFELFNLTDSNNHKIEKIGDYYYWFRKSNDKWERLEKDFESINKAKEYIHYNIGHWTKELFNRRFPKKPHKLYIKDLNSKSIHDKIRNIKAEYPYLSQKRLAEHFSVSISTIKRALRG